MADSRAVTLSMAEPDIAVITFDDPTKGANVLSRHIMEQLEECLNELDGKSGIAGLVVRSGKPGAFIAGADINEFVEAKDVTKEMIVEMCTRGRKLLARLSTAPYVTVAAVHGTCLGGGAELALWCDRRVLSSDHKTQYGFPEVQLGIYPGWGGTARAPRVIGLANAIELICGGQPIRPDAAYKMGIACDVVPSERLEAAAIRVIRDEQKTKEYLADRKRWSTPLDIDDTELAFVGATSSAYIQQQTKGQYPAPPAALNTMVGAARLDIAGAGQMEAEGMANLFGTPVNRALINVFFLMERNKKDPGVDKPGIEAQPIHSLGVVGAGIMGAGIAAAAVRKRVPVTITDAFVPALSKGVKGILEEVSFNKETKSPDGKKMLDAAPLVNATTSDAEFAACDLVIEAVVENIDVKRQLFGRIEPQLKDGAILATNTSTIPITELAQGLKRPDRFCGIHFFNPVRRMPLVEVIRGPQTSDQTVATAVAFAKAIGKSPIVVSDGPGFLVNRLLLPYMNEALELLLDGAEIKQIERAAKSFGMPMGPIELYDVVGIDTALFAGKTMRDAFPDRVVESPLLPAMFEAKRLGQKTGAGFYLHTGRKAQPDPAVAQIIDPLIRRRDSFSEEQIRDRLFLPMVLEATRILDERIVRDPRDVDLGLIFGTGFPPFKGGLLFWADTLGAARLVEQLKPLESLGERARPTAMLLDLARSGRGFYG